MAEINVRLDLKGWNATQLSLRVPFIMTAYRDVMWEQLKEEIKTVQFKWTPGVITYRYGRLRKTKSLSKSLKIFQEQGFRTGVPVGSPRDIVDSGTFLNSQKVTQPNPTTLRFTWDAASEDGFMYPALIFTGGSVGERSTPIPGRDWIKPALDKHPFDRFFVTEWQKLSNSRL